MYVCYYGSGSAWIVVVEDELRGGIFYYCDALKQGRAAATRIVE